VATPLWQRRVERIIELTEQFSVDDIRRSGAALRQQCALPGHDLAWWRETMSVDRELRRARRSRAAALAAHRAVEALEMAARRGGLVTEDVDVLCIADALRSMTRAAAVGFLDSYGADVFDLNGTMTPRAYVPAPSPPAWTAQQTA